MDPLNARFWFKFRNLVQGLIALVLFTMLLLIIPLNMGGLLCGILVGGVGTYYLFAVLHQKPFAVKCPHCRKILSTNTTWVCSRGHTNSDTQTYPFINECETCRNQPKSYLCHYQGCGKHIYFSEDHSESDSARKWEPSKSHIEQVAEQEHEVRTKKHELLVAELDAKAEAQKTKQQPLRMKSHTELIQEKLLADEARVLGVEDAGRARKADLAKIFANDPDELKRRTLWVDRWVAENQNI